VYEALSYYARRASDGGGGGVVQVLQVQRTQKGVCGLDMSGAVPLPLSLRRRRRLLRGT
jgi:hypothetical protein